jgi:ribosomal protein S17
MERTVTVEHRHTIWDRHIRKNYPKVTRFLVSDPQNSLREGDVIEFSSGAPKSRHVRHVVERIIAPFGEAIEDRPAILTREERDAVRAEKRERRCADLECAWTRSCWTYSEVSIGENWTCGIALD